MKMMVDTSVWIECTKDQELLRLIERIVDKHEIRGCEVIDEEINRAVNFLREKNRQDAELVKRLYFENKKATVRTSPIVSEIAKGYALEGQKVGLPVQDMQADFFIVSSASVDRIPLVATFNRKTMASDNALLVYKVVNEKRSLGTPNFLVGKERLRMLLFL